MRIGFLDSGIGGISVLREALKILPNESYIYYADAVHAPYGTKPKGVVREYIFEAVDFMARQGIKGLVVACNTATSIAINDLREKYQFPVIGMEPAVKPAVERSRNKDKRVLVLATPLTLKEEKFHDLVTRVDDDHIVDSLPLPELVEYAEHFEFRSEVIIPYLKENLSSFNWDEYGTVVLGCTHFPLFRDAFRRVLPDHVDIIDGNAATARHMKNMLEQRDLLGASFGEGEIVFFNSGKREEDEKRLEVYRQLIKQT